jgi:hypothetical protein
MPCQIGRKDVTHQNGHVAGFLVSNDDDAGIEAVASTLSKKYVKTEALAVIAATYKKLNLNRM